MNILPKKSWHVRSRKNIERVQKDEAEAERLAKIELDKKARIEQEMRRAELRRRIEPSTSSTIIDSSPSITPSNMSLTSSVYARDGRGRMDSSQRSLGMNCKLVSHQGLQKPWYFKAKPAVHQKRPIVDKIISMHDPMVAMKHVEDVLKAKKAEKRSHRNNTNIYDPRNR